MSAGRRRHFVILEDKQTHLPLNPSSIYVNLIPGGPSDLDEERNIFTVEAAYHPEITYHTILHYGDRQLFVRGIENVGERNRDMVLYCHEVKTP